MSVWVIAMSEVSVQSLPSAARPRLEHQGRCGGGVVQATATGQSSCRAELPDGAPPPTDSSTGELESAIGTLRRSLAAIMDVGKWLDRVGTASAIGVHAVSKERAGIEIRTQEGDVIRIKYSNRVELNVGTANTEGATATEASLTQRQRLRVSVEGNLNEQERRAIDDVLAKIDALAQEFFAGDVESSFAQAAQLGFDSEQLAKVAVRFSQRQQVSAVAVQAIEPQAPKAIPAPIVEAPVVAPIADVPVEENASPPTDPVAAETPALPEPTKPAVAENAVATYSLIRFVAKLSVHLRASAQDERMGLSFHSKLKLLVENIELRKPAGEVDGGAIDKLKETAAAIAA
jgi:hypothetical protein